MQHRLRVGVSRIAGWGVFATQRIGMHDVIGEYRGEVVSGTVRRCLRLPVVVCPVNDKSMYGGECRWLM